MKFDSLKINKFIKRSLDENGLEEMTPVQEQSIPVLFAGKDLLSIAPTGTGKTLAYILPLVRSLHYAQGTRPRALILVPTKELIFQVEEVFKKVSDNVDLRIALIYGEGNKNKQIKALEDGCDIVVATPGRIQEMVSIRALHLNDIKHFIVDEADTLLDEGFATQFKYVLDALPEKRQNALFSATFSHETQAIAHSFLKSAEKVVIGGGIALPEKIHQRAIDVPNIKTKLNVLADLVNDVEVFSKVLIFTETKKVAERVQQFLHHRYFEGTSDVVHSNKDQNYRLRVLDEFKNGILTAVVATGVIGKGVDIEGVTHVINFEVPKDYEDYVHQIGRTARAGNSGESITLVEPDEYEDFENIQKWIGVEVPLEELPEGTMVIEMQPRGPRIDKHGNSVRHKNQRKDDERGDAFHEKKEKNKKVNVRVKAMKGLSKKAQKTLGLKSNGRPRKRRK
ncbi:DEAD/DEAH box helicase [Aureibacter tunicatorum]|uniref:ATP-dependent RNA helicase RhlE n=1 Tax=Aureibacter tunicatorum TaxID=866807 RepID=A0AAE4BTC4_9BACT|nr:DEAD/DEAH box helicase [Aureibacter tunicatorum]MDR6239698.1 ATP-dependent RNA helicase RhlE [Aureibacter tunicatorum]BDD04174.1 DEAD/DEAH box helicase [Aureibacter tunicatorum]